MSVDFPSINLRTIGTYKIFTYLSNTLSSFSSFQSQLSTIFGTNELGTGYRSWNAATGAGILGTQFKPNSGYLLITRYPNTYNINIDSGVEFDLNAYGMPISGTYTFITYPYANQNFATYTDSLCTIFGLNDAETSYRSWSAKTGAGILGTQFKSNSGYLIVAKKPFWLLNPNYNPVPTVTPTNTITETLTLTPTNTPTLTNTVALELTQTPTQTQTSTNTPTNTPTISQTNTPTQTSTSTPTNTSSSTPIPTATPTRTPSIPTVYVAGENYGTTFVPAPINQLDNITVKGELIWFNTIVGRDILTGKWFVDFTEQPGNWSKLSCGNSYIIALSAGTNKLFGKGSYAMGLLGIGSQQEFTQVPGDWSDFACGLSHTVAQSAGTNVWFGTGQWGAMSLGLGFGSTDNSGDNDIKDTTVLTQLSGQWSKMVCGQLTTFALSAGTDRWFATGINGSGNLGGLTPRPGYSLWGGHVDQFTILPYNWEKINCTVQHVFALSANTSKWFGWGRNNYDWWPVGDSRAYGALGLNNADYSRTTPTIIPGNWTDILPGSDHSCALSANTNKWFVAGKNNVGQLGTENTTNTLVFTMVPGNWSKMYPGSTITVAVSAT